MTSVLRRGHFLYVIIMAASLEISATSVADEPMLRAGEYIMEGGNGRLSLEKSQSGRFTFSIVGVGANNHVCSLDGEVQKTQEMIGGRPCLVSFHATAQGIEVGTETEGCRDYCGARADFSGHYLTPAKGCALAEVDETRRKFKELYDKKAFLQAKTTLEPVLSRCTATMNYLDSAWVRNDLAITQYRLKNFAACIGVLKPLSDVAASYEGVEVENVTPELQGLVPVMKATLVNLTLCGARVRR